ncbi:MAG: hypothetical protein ACRDV9_06160 [Acidimicrobiia bacterium]
MRKLWKGLAVGSSVGAAIDNSWKGLVVGGIIGAATGSALEVLNRGACAAGQVKHLAEERAGGALDWGREVTERASGWLHDNDLPERTRELAHRIADSEAGARVKSATEGLAEAVQEKVGRS